MRYRTSHELMARRVAAELKQGEVVTLGPGLPGMVPGYMAADRGAIFHAENGVLGYGPAPGRGGEEPELVDGGGGPIGLSPGATIINQAESFGIVRGGYVDVAVLEALQVSERGDLVGRNASLELAAVFGAPSEIATGAKILIAMMEHTTRDGAPRIVWECSYSPIEPGCVNLIVTDLAVIQVAKEGLLLMETAPGWTVDQVQAVTGAHLIPAPGLNEMGFAHTPGHAVNKVYPSASEAVADVPDGAVVMLDGFAGPGGTAQYLILALRDQGAKNLTMISNTAGIARVASFGSPPGSRPVDHSVLVDNGQIKKAVASFPVSPSPSRPSSFELAYRRGEAELELVPQGTLAERIRAGAHGIAGFYTLTGAGTQIAEGKETRVIDGRMYVLEHGIRGDYALIRAHKADTMGNLVYKGTSRNFNAVMAPAAAITIVEVDEIVERGDLDPDAIVTPGIFVQRVVRRPPDFHPYEPTE